MGSPRVRPMGWNSIPLVWISLDGFYNEFQNMLLLDVNIFILLFFKICSDYFFLFSFIHSLILLFVFEIEKASSVFPLLFLSSLDSLLLI